MLLFFATNHHEFRDACITGVGFGMSAVFWKYTSGMVDWAGLESFELSAWLNAFKTPGLYFYIITYIVGFIYSQISLSRGRAVFVIPLSAALGTFIPILGGWVVFQEPISSVKIIAMISILIGSVFFIRAGTIAGKNYQA